MIGIGSRILILAGSGLIGYWLASDYVDRSADVIVSKETARREAPPPDERPRFPKASPFTCESETEAGEGPRHGDEILQPTLSALPETGLPRKYRKMLEPRSREPSTWAEWYRAFVSEPRDDAWATPVEARIGEVISVSGIQGIQAEYVACGTRRCTVAGYVDPTEGFDSCSIGAWIGRARIFRRTFGLTCKDEEIAGLQRFIVFIDSERPL